VNGVIIDFTGDSGDIPGIKAQIDDIKAAMEKPVLVISKI
jgi:hypothetical protein